ncbi:gamma-butyrobetaine dioxygenase-like [Oculina patagonica]
MAAILRAPFRIAALSYCRDLLKITWQDGAKSEFPSIWLRSSVRDSPYFAVGSCLYNQNAHASFMCKESSIIRAENTMGSENVDIEWEDHHSSFNASWLRAQDMANNDSLRKETEISLWDSNFKFPVYNYSERMARLESWLSDLKRYGVAFFEGVPPSQEGLEGILHCVGQPKQRIHPTDTLVVATDNKNEEKIDQDIYTSEQHPFHIDTAYYNGLNRLSCLVTTRYNAPVQDTFNYWVDNLTITETLRHEDPEAYELLSTIPVRFSRRRMDVQEECSDPYIYQYDNTVEKKLISFDPAERRHPTVYVSNKQAGMELGRFKDHSTMKKYYEAYRLLQLKLSDPVNHQKFLLKEGTAAIFNNHRVSHARGDIHPSTDRCLHLGFIGAEAWNTRWRVLYGEKSGLEDKWLYGCSNEQLEILADRKEKQVM